MERVFDSSWCGEFATRLRLALFFSSYAWKKPVRVFTDRLFVYVMTIFVSLECI